MVTPDRPKATAAKPDGERFGSRPPAPPPPPLAPAIVGAVAESAKAAILE
jgi:hypothetical protein